LKSFALLYTFGKGRWFTELGSLLADGNAKVSPQTAIFNFSSATDCISMKLGLCAAVKAGVKCYAKKAEASYHPNVLPYRRRQEKYWDSVTAKEFAAQFLLINSTKANSFTALRFSEAGDFRNQKDIDKAEEVAMILARYNIKTYCYTSRSDLSFSGVKYMIVSGSNFQKDGITNIFKIIKSKKERPKGFGICSGNCRICFRCKIRGKKTVVLAH